MQSMQKVCSFFLNLRKNLSHHKNPNTVNDACTSNTVCLKSLNGERNIMLHKTAKKTITLKST